MSSADKNTGDKNKGMVVWFTGLSGSGKTTLAKEVRARMEKLGKRVKILDGDEVRKTHTPHLGFSREDIKENDRVVSELALRESQKHDFVLVSIISPYREDRARARAELSPHFVEIFVDTPLEVCKSRDAKGLYRKAESGEIQNMIGVSGSSPYEIPLSPEFCVKTHEVSPEKGAGVIMDYLYGKNILQYHES